MKRLTVRDKIDAIGTARGWMLVSVNRHCVYDGLLGDCDFENCGKTWLAYRRRPEEEKEN